MYVSVIKNALLLVFRTALLPAWTKQMSLSDLKFTFCGTKWCTKKNRVKYTREAQTVMLEGKMTKYFM